ncbi:MULTISPECIES: BON domain-containing protein [Acidobacterium]|uniref:Phospholipid-binding protein n=1 Tax=Acidobacterium capsulatum (strain ATCC 51196 / DSM 11244 / BCRC 80197 / JCM 7670 / NBRC 15755 / NCIMB 13165 / 161) TaxID=240015 RepID=C1F1K4_ACIC5|nr:MULTISPECIES: BON domain-containing protein [Acidobacterium]ACO33251.1 phospholipid-binding protein [Acidobacterium capsulatum ATCC 51196]HCT61374.1 BON domain-containing protein [Acidobacterium sp.]
MKFRTVISSLTLASLLLVPAGLQAQSNDAQLQAQAKSALHKSAFKDVQVSAQNGTVVLSGTVKYYAEKVQAEKRVKKADGSAAVQNNIEVAGTNVSDEQLAVKLGREIENSRVGYGTTAFNAISVGVHNGVVVLGGSAYGPVDASTAYNLAANTAGVKEVINHIQVDPTSPLDDRIRRAEYRAIYGFPQLNRYALNPIKPIRIVVQNGHVTLKGVVDSTSDKQVAGIRANSVSGVFSVTNDLQVAGQER